MSFLGADTDQLRGCSDHYERGSRRLHELIETLGTAVDSVNWVGPDAESFRTGVRQSVSEANAVAERIAENGRELETQATEQDVVSGDGAAGPGGGAPGEPGTVEDPGDAEGTEAADEGIPEDPTSVHPNNSAQGSIGDCYLLSSLGAIGQQDPDFLADHVDEVEPGVYEVTMYDENGEPITYRVETVQEGGVSDGDGEQNLYSVYERAYKMHLDARGENIDGGWPKDAMQTITGQESADYRGADRPSVQEMEALLENGRLVNADTGGVEDPSHDDVAGGHAYTVTDVDAEAGTVTVTNPWGAEASMPQTVTMSYEEYLETFPNTSVGRTEDPNVIDWIDERIDGTHKY